MTRNFYTTEHIEKKVFWALVFFAMMFIALYIYFVASATFAIVERQQIEKGIIATNGSLSGIESKYLALSNQMTPDFIRSLGYIEILAPHFVSRTGLALSSH
ncbi:MAG: hypothetical protein HZC04_01005 [Candidatus Lloydbacteria bacterium]|nr:hypothetical protein [Candidatus Lloydbacteria bacterium]